MKRKLLAGVLSLCMIFSLIPVGAFAAFDDTNGHWGAASAERWSQAGVLNGDDTGNFNPDKQMTRAEFAQMLCNLMGYTEKAPNNFSDVPNDAWYADAILKLVAAGVMNGVSDTSAAPQAPITREQAAVLLCRAMNITPSANASVTFSDAGSVSSWAKDAVAALTERGMINGVGNNNFAPANNIVRAAVAQMVDNMVAEYVTQSGATVTGEVKGVVIIKADNVKIEDATLAENVIVAPAAENATVTLTGSTQAAGVVVGAEGAKVVVDSTATAESVTVDAPKAQTEIAGKVDTVAVTENAESAKTTVAKDAEVKTVTVDAPKAETQVSGKVDTVAVAQNAESAKTTVAKDAEVTNMTVAAPKADTSISGTVSKVDVAQSATGANVTANAGAKVDSVTTAANDVKVNGADNTIGTVTTTGGTADVTSKGTEVKNEGADKVTVDGNKDVPKGDSTTSDKTTPSGGGSGGGGGGGNQPQTNDRVVDAIFHDTRTAQGTTVADSALKAGYSVTDKTVDGDTTKVTINHQNIWQHQNAQPEPVLGYWTGFAVKAPADVVAGQVKYKTGATKAEVGTGLASVALEDVDQSGSANGLAFYFNMANNETKAEKWIAIQWKDDSAIEYYQVNFANTSMKPEVENVKLQVVENLGDVKKLPTEVQTVLCLDDFLSQTNNNAATDDMPWLVVTYDRNVASVVTFAVTKDGTPLTTGFTDNTSASTIRKDACQSWSMIPKKGSSGQLWSAKPDIISGTYAITLTVAGETFTASAPKYDRDGEDTVTVTFDSNGGSNVTPQTIKKDTTATVPTTVPTKDNNCFVGWYKADGTKFDFSTTISSDITLTAKWEEIKPGEISKDQTWSSASHGVTLSDNSAKTSEITYTVNADTLLKNPMAAASWKQGNNYYTDIAIKAPTGFDKSTWTVELKNGTSNAVPVTQDLDTDTRDSVPYIVDWFSVAKGDGNGNFVFCEDQTFDLTYYFYQGTDANKVLKAVNKVTINRVTTLPTDVDVVAAPIADHPQDGGNAITDLGTVTIESKALKGFTAKNDKFAPIYDITLKGVDIKKHHNANGIEGYWVGFGMPTKSNGDYTYIAGNDTIVKRTFVEGGKTYQSVYFSEESQTTFGSAKYTITVKDGETIISTYNVSFDVTTATATPTT